MTTTPGFILTRQWHDERDGVRLDFWLSTPQGPLPVSLHRQKALFFIRQADAGRAERSLQQSAVVEIRPIELKTFKAETVSAVYFNSQQQLYRARDQLQLDGIACYEADIRPPERFLCERFITASVDIAAGYDVAGLHDVRLSPGDYVPQLEVMSLDIESDYETSTLFSIAFVSTSLRQVIMIGDGSDREGLEFVADEAALLRRWLEWLNRIDPIQPFQPAPQQRRLVFDEFQPLAVVTGTDHNDLSQRVTDEGNREQGIGFIIRFDVERHHLELWYVITRTQSYIVQPGNIVVRRYIDRCGNEALAEKTLRGANISLVAGYAVELQLIAGSV